MIDFLAVLPFEKIMLFINNNMQSNSQSSSDNPDQDFTDFVRVARISKLYKLVKITRLFRVLKIMKQKKKIAKRVKSAITGGQQIERLSFLIMILFILCHFIGCLWIFIANIAGDEAKEEDTWLKYGGY